MENWLEVSFLVPGDQYGDFKDICRLKNTNPSYELNRYIQEVIQKDREHFDGFRISYAALCVSEEIRKVLAYKGWEKTRQQKLADAIIENVPDLIIMEDYIQEKAAPFYECLKKQLPKIL